MPVVGWPLCQLWVGKGGVARLVVRKSKTGKKRCEKTKKESKKSKNDDDDDDDNNNN